MDRYIYHEFRGEYVNEILFGEPFEIVFRGYSNEDCEYAYNWTRS